MRRRPFGQARGWPRAAAVHVPARARVRGARLAAHPRLQGRHRRRSGRARVWQRKHTVKNLQGAEGRARATCCPTTSPRASSGTSASGRRCRMLVPPQMLNTMNEADLWGDPVRRYMLPAFEDRRTDWPNHPKRQPRQPPRGGHVGGRGADPPLPDQGAGGDAAHLPAVLRPLHPHGPGGQRRAAGGEAPFAHRARRSATSRSSTTCARRPPCATWWSPAATSPTCPSRQLEPFVSALMDIPNIRDIRLATKGLMGIPQHFLQDSVLAGAGAAGEEGASSAAWTSRCTPT